MDRILLRSSTFHPVKIPAKNGSVIAGMKIAKTQFDRSAMADPFFAGDAFAGPAGDLIYDLSVGYDLAGIKSDKVQLFLDGMRDASASLSCGCAGIITLPHTPDPPARIFFTRRVIALLSS